MLRKTGILIVLVAIMFQVIRPISPYINYRLNKEYIANFLCINKDKPEMACNGKCHLANQIKKQAEEEEKSEQNAPEKQRKDVSASFDIINQFHKSMFNKMELVFSIKHIYKEIYNYTFLIFVFHPPG